MKRVLSVAGWILWGLGLVILGLPTLDGTLEDGGILLGLYVFLSAVYFLVHFRMKGIRKQKVAAKAEWAEKVEAGVIPAHTHTARHEAGLPVPSGSPCEVRVFAQKLEFLSGAQLFRVPMERVLGAQEYNDTEMRAYTQSSMFQTILGGAAFGAAGAIIGAMPETKYRREVSKHNLAIHFVTEAGETSAVVVSADTSLVVLNLAIGKYCRGMAPKEATTL